MTEVKLLTFLRSVHNLSIIWFCRTNWIYLDRVNSNWETHQTLEGFNELEIDFHPAFVLFPVFIIIIMCCVCCTISKIIRNTVRNIIPVNDIPPAGTMPCASSSTTAGAESIIKQIFLRILCEIMCRKIFNRRSNCGNNNFIRKFNFDAKPKGGAVGTKETLRLATGFGGTSKRWT